jgi:methionyl-tRNA formyltransferase
LSTAERCLRLGFAGTPDFAVAALNALAGSRHEIAAVFTKSDKPAGRGQATRYSPVKRRAAELGLPVQQPQSFKTAEVLETVRELRLDALVVVAYGLILPAPALALPALGCFNIHASLLPRWRGAAPIHRALLAGDTVTGITIMRMDPGLDTGPMLAVRQLDVAPDETAGSLHDRLASLGGELIVETLDAVASGDTYEHPQPDSGVTYADKIAKSEAVIDWSDDAASVLRRVRAFNPWPVAETALEGVQLRVWQAELAPPAEGGAANAPPGTVLLATDAGIDVACGRGALRILRLQLAGRKPLAAQEFIRAQRLDGARFTRP